MATMTAFRFPVAALIFAGFLLPAAAKDCPALTLLNTLPLEPVGDDAAMLVSVRVQGVPEKMLLDTGGLFSQLSQDVVKQLNLDERDSEITLIDVAGNPFGKKTRVSKFEFGRMAAGPVEFQVAPPGFPGDGIAGIFAPNLFLRDDIDLDFADRKMNYFSPDHCEGQIQYWPAPAVAAVPFRMIENHIQVKVIVDGKPLDAIIDTGASRTAMSQEIAQRVFGLAPESPGMTLVGNVAGDATLKRYGYVFASLSFEGVAVSNPHMFIIPDVVAKGADNGLKTGSNVKRWSDDVKLPPVIIGMNVLKKLHLYIAFKEGKLYITPASVPAAIASPTSQTEPAGP